MGTEGLRVLVTDGDNRAALSITRSLGRRGHHVVVAARRSPALAQTSRFCAERAVYPDPTQDGCGFISALAELVELHKINVLLPVTDVTTLLVTAHRARFEPACRIPFADVEVIERAADKVDVVQTAVDLGVPVPRTFFLASAAALAGCLSELTFPVVVKPRRSRLETAAGWTSTSVRYARDAGELAAMVREKHELEFPLLLQEHITGPGVGVFVCYNRGVPTAWFSHRRLREKPPSGGVSTLAESIELSPVTRRYSELLLNELGWHGVAMVEFKIDQRDGVPKLMEINGRFWGSLQLAIDAGVDFPALLLEEFDVGKPKFPTYRVGVRSRWFWGDFDSLLITLRGGPLSHSPSGRLRAIAEFLKLWGKDLYYENPRASDLKPWWYETRQWFGALS